MKLKAQSHYEVLRETGFIFTESCHISIIVNLKVAQSNNDWFGSVICTANFSKHPCL